jgi:hypothetical protein
MTRVDSTSLAAVGYDRAAGALLVTFRDSGETYRFAGVPEPLFDQLLTAPSKGAFFNRWIKPNFPDVAKL